MAKKKNDAIQVTAQQAIITNNPNVSPYLFNLDRIDKPNCIMCQSEHREEIEQMYEDQKKKNYSAIKHKLKDAHDFDISRDALRNHLIRHYAKVSTNAILQDYTEEVQQWVNMQGNRVASTRARIAVLEREYFTIASQSDDLDLFERRKNAECLKKLAETMLLLENKIAEFAEEAKPVNVLFNQLTVIVNDEMAHVDSLTSKKLVSKILDRLKDTCGDMLTG
jgi:ribosomal protein L9